VIVVDGERLGEVDALDRGLLYGDGLFETVLFVDGRAPLWERHIARLTQSCARLRLDCPDELQLLRDCATALGTAERAVLRLTVTRGSGARGYAPPRGVAPRRIVAAFPVPEVPVDWYDPGVCVRFCDLRLATQPALAGMKHLNRLGQVLARAEWDDLAIAEGLLCDAEGLVVCATAANLFAVIDGVLTTPPLDRCGVAGVARAEVLARRRDARIAAIDRAALARAEEVFLSSSVRGIVPVRLTPDAQYDVGKEARLLQQIWRGLGLMPAERGA
jgi:4-amino-4-deoxychorismate lyase